MTLHFQLPATSNLHVKLAALNYTLYNFAFSKLYATQNRQADGLQTLMRSLIEGPTDNIYVYTWCGTTLSTVNRF